MNIFAKDFQLLSVDIVVCSGVVDDEEQQKTTTMTITTMMTTTRTMLTRLNHACFSIAISKQGRKCLIERAMVFGEFFA